MKFCVTNPALTLAVCEHGWVVTPFVKKHVANISHQLLHIRSEDALLEKFADIDIFIFADDFILPDKLQILLHQKKTPLLKGFFVLMDFDLEYPAHCIVESLTWPISPVAFSRKFKTIASLIARDKLLQIKEVQLAHYHELIESEKIIAKNIFETVIQADFIHYPELDFMLSPSSTYNGDILLAHKNKNGIITIMLGDFTGHGLPAAIGSIPTAEIFYAMCEKQIALSGIIREINKKLNKLLPTNMFCAACLVSYNTYSGKLSIWQGGVPTGYLIDENSQHITEITTKHLPLGILNVQEFDDTMQVYEVNTAMSLTLFTDGLIEMKNSKNQTLSQAQIISCLKVHPAKNKVSALKKLLTQHDTSTKKLDDIAIFSLALMPKSSVA